MNYLAHIFYSGDDLNLMVNNLFGDFVKGKNFNSYKDDVQKGIELHRKLDSFIDTHESIKIIKNNIQSNLPKVYPIAIDLYYDHFLAKNWSKFHSDDFDVFLNKFFSHLNSVSNIYNDEFHFFLNLLSQKKWLFYYKTLFGLYKSSQGVSNKLNFNNELYKAHFVYIENLTLIENQFYTFTESAISTFLNK